MTRSRILNLRLGSALGTFVSLAIAATAQAGGPEHVGNGGNTVDLSGRPVLRDLVENTNCDWFPGHEVLEKNPHFKKVIRNLNRVHPYFANELAREAAQLKFCFTNEALKAVSTDDQDAVTIYSINPTTRQVAIRVNGSVYVDSRLYKAMDPVNRTYLLVHETMHTYIPLDMEQRNQKLRSFVSTIRKHELSPMSLSRFSMQMEQAGVSFPLPNEILTREFESFSKLQELYAAQSTDYTQVVELANRVRDIPKEAFLPGTFTYEIPVILAIRNDSDSELARLLDTHYASGGSVEDWFLWTLGNTASSKVLTTLAAHFSPGSSINRGNPMAIAASLNHVEQVRTLLKIRGVNPNLSADLPESCRTYHSLNYPIVCAARLGHFDVVIEMAKDPKVDVNVHAHPTGLGFFGWYTYLMKSYGVLYRALLSNRVDVVAFLLRTGRMDKNAVIVRARGSCSGGCGIEWNAVQVAGLLNREFSGYDVMLDLVKNY